jgi:hypothetical protein
MNRCRACPVVLGIAMTWVSLAKPRDGLALGL